MQTAQGQPAPTVSCEECLKKFTDLKVVSTTPEGEAQFTTDSNRIIDETTFSKWLSEFEEQIFLSSCAYKKISVSVTLTAGYYLQAVLVRSDHDLLKQGKISSAERQRRYDLKRVETLAYLLQALKDAREKGNQAQALSLIDRILEKEPQNQNVLLIKANVLLDQKLYADAVLLYQSILVTQPDSLIARFNLGYALKELGSFSEALTAFEIVLNTPPPTGKTDPGRYSNDAVMLNLVDAALRNNDLEKATNYSARIQNRTTPEAALLNAQYLRMQGKFTEAKDVLQELAGRSLVAPEVLFDLTLAYLDLKDIMNAKLTFERLKRADETMANELAFLPPFKTGEVGVQRAAVVSDSVQQAGQPAVDAADDDMDYAEQPAESDEGEGQKF